MSLDKQHSSGESLIVSRRLAIHGGLASLAAALVQTHLAGCVSETPETRLNAESVDQGLGNDVDQMTTTDLGDQSLTTEMNETMDMSAWSEQVDTGSQGGEMVNDAGVHNEMDMLGGDDIVADFPMRILPERPSLRSEISSINC